MTEIEIKSIATQLDLLRDISRNSQYIIRSVQDKAKTIRIKARESARCPQDVPDEKCVISIPKKDWEQILDFLIALETGNYGSISSYLGECANTNQIKEDILKTLQ